MLIEENHHPCTIGLNFIYKTININARKTTNINNNNKTTAAKQVLYNNNNNSETLLQNRINNNNINNKKSNFNKILAIKTKQKQINNKK